MLAGFKAVFWDDPVDAPPDEATVQEQKIRRRSAEIAADHIRVAGFVPAPPASTTSTSTGASSRSHDGEGSDSSRTEARRQEGEVGATGLDHVTLVSRPPAAARLPSAGR